MVFELFMGTSPLSVECKVGITHNWFTIHSQGNMNDINVHC